MHAAYGFAYMSILYATAYIDRAYANAYMEIWRVIMTDQIARNEKQLGAILRRARRQADLTQEALGKQIHLRQATVSRLEAGEPAVQLSTLMAALYALDLELVVRPRSKGSAAEIEDLF